MKIADFKSFIQKFPYENQSFDIKRENWKIDEQKSLVDKVFGDSTLLTLNRHDLINSSNENIEEFIIKTLMWGYPTKGRGRNIPNMLKPDNFKPLIILLNNYRNKDI